MRWRLWRGRRAREAELAEEIDAHFRLAVQERMEGGETHEQALAAVRREFGSEAHVREVTRMQWAGARVEQTLRELGIAFRTLRRTPRFTMAAVLCIGLGIGATMTVFSALHAILLRPLPYPHAGELVALRAQHVTRGNPGASVSVEVLESWRGMPAMSELGTWRTTFSDLTGPEAVAETVGSAAVSANLFPLLGVRPLHGRSFDAQDVADGGKEVVLIGHDLWRSRFGGDLGLVGGRIELGGRPHVVVGIMSPGFSFPEGTSVWRPLVTPSLPPNILFYDGAIATLAAGASLADARAQVDAAIERLRAESGYDGWSFTVASLRSDLVGPLRTPILIFQAAALLVLLLACGNVAALMLARATARRHEFSLRAVLGADGARLRGHILTESAAVALLGGVIGVGITYAGVRLLRLAFPDGVPSWIDLSVHVPTLLVTATATLGAALLFGLAPALRAGRVSGARGIPDSSHVHSTVARTRTHNGLVVVQIAAAVVLLAAATLLIRTHSALEQSLGFEHEGVLSVSVRLPTQRYPEPERRELFRAQLRERLGGLAGVERVKLSMTTLPLDEGQSFGLWRFQIEGRETIPGERQQVARWYYVTPGYFDLLRVPVLQGRDLNEDDVRAGDSTALVNETFARRYFPGGGVVGQRIVLATDTDTDPDAEARAARIVGVVRDFRRAPPPAEIQPALYAVQPPDAPAPTFLLATTLPDPTVVAPAVRRILHELDPALTATIQSHTGMVQRTFWQQRLQRNVIGTFAALALSLALFGVYGTLSYAVAQRTTELGVRLALGSSPFRLLLYIVGSAARLAAAGVVTGVFAAFGLARLLQGMLYGVTPGDPWILGAVAVVVSAVALCAAALPAIRASRLDPQLAIRSPE